jgi:hypothetical protein
MSTRHPDPAPTLNGPRPSRVDAILRLIDQALADAEPDDQPASATKAA